jgi:cell division protease FtsH
MRKEVLQQKMDFDEDEEIEEIDCDECHAMEEDDEETWPEFERRARRIHKKNRETIRTFLGKGRQEQVSVIRPRYYGDLLAWAVKHYIEKENWKTTKVMGREAEVPDYTTVDIDYDRQENTLSSGYMLLEREDYCRAVVSLRIDYRSAASVVIVSNRKKIAQDFEAGIGELAQGKNLYQGKKIQPAAHVRFLKLQAKTWEDLALAPELKAEIKTNTVDFLNRKEELAKYSISPRRGVMLTGVPGTGKTLIGKIIMNESPGITCISAMTGYLVHVPYIHELYALARDLKPSIVFLEDIDLIGEDRRSSKGPLLPVLLAELDGIEECAEVVTIASTNFLDSIDDALKKRPSRFDRIIQLPLPSLEQRRGFVRYLAGKIPMPEDVQEHMAYRTENLTPAQIQEVAYSLVIEHKHTHSCNETGYCRFSVEEVDNAISKTCKRKKELGFRTAGNNGNGSMVEAMSHRSIIIEDQEQNIGG